MSKEYFYLGHKILTPFQVLSDRLTYESETLSLKRLSFSSAAQRWRLAFTVVGGLGSDMGEVFMRNTLGFHRAYQMIMPQHPWVTDGWTITGSLEVSQTAQGGDNDVTVTRSGNVILPLGSFVSFEGHDKVYTLREAYTGTGTLKVFPRIHDTLSIGTKVNIGDSVSLRYKQDSSNVSGIMYEDGVLVSPGTIQLIEDV